MEQRRRIVFVLGAVALALLLVGCGNQGSAGGQAQPAAASGSAGSSGYDLTQVRPRSLNILDRMGEAHIMGQTHLTFTRALEELSGGKLTTTRYLSGEIETGNAHLRDDYGTVMDAGRMQLELLGYYGYERGRVFGLPFLFSGREHFWAFADSAVGKQVLEEIAAMNWNVVPLAYIEEGARHFFTRRPIRGFADLAGQKIRVQNSELYVGLVQAIGASATPMAWGEVYTALSTGVVDGAENPYSGYKANMLNEVAPYLIETGHIFAGGTYNISSRIWNELNDTEKAIVREAAQRAGAFNRAMIDEMETQVKRDLQAAGVTIIPFNAADRERALQLVGPLYTRFAADHVQLIEQIQGIR